MRSTQRIRVAALVAAFLAVAVASAQATSWTCPDGYAGQTLHVYNWTTYVAEDTIQNFEKLCDVKVVYDTYPSDDDMLARIRQGNPGYDVVVPSGVTVYLMAQQGLLEPLDKGMIPNVANLDPTFTDLPYDPGNVYTVPYQWGTVGIGYNVTRVGHEITSWQDLFDYAGPVSWLDDVPAMMGVGLLLTGHDPNSADPKDVADAKQYLVDHGQNVVYINQDDGQEVLARGEADIVVEYSGDIFQLMDECGCDDYAYVIPSEGTNFWVDNLAIPVDAPNKALAEVFIDYLLDPQVGADISNYTAYGSPNQAAKDQGLIDPDYLSDPGIYPNAETQNNLFYATQDAEREQLLNDAWDEIKIYVGR